MLLLQKIWESGVEAWSLSNLTKDVALWFPLSHIRHTSSLFLFVAFYYYNYLPQTPKLPVTFALVTRGHAFILSTYSRNRWTFFLPSSSGAIPFPKISIFLLFTPKSSLSFPINFSTLRYVLSSFLLANIPDSFNLESSSLFGFFFIFLEVRGKNIYLTLIPKWRRGHFSKPLRCPNVDVSIWLISNGGIYSESVLGNGDVLLYNNERWSPSLHLHPSPNGIFFYNWGLVPQYTPIAHRTNHY